MREGKRIKGQKSLSDKIILYTGVGIAILAIIVFSLFLYSKSLSDEVKNSTMSLEEMANLTNSTNTQNTESASTDIGKTVEEIENETNTANEMTSNTNATTSTNQVTDNTVKNSTSENKISNTVSSTVKNETSDIQEKTKELSFSKPVEGEIMREYAKDNLVYSETLQEWTTHTGIDIKADKTTVVTSAEAGTVKSIKNDPRYGLTIVIEHDEHYQTVYSNLLTSEFVVEGEKVEKGQSIGTVGNTAVFEIADEPHLHFEIWKDSLPVDPSTYIK